MTYHTLYNKFYDNAPITKMTKINRLEKYLISYPQPMSKLRLNVYYKELNLP